ncbi:MAG: hypothetical protein HY459_03695 [Parcubacteria group bacterium]|nr:hypothetical protein [Parcubacteria group bacterium]
MARAREEGARANRAGNQQKEKPEEEKEQPLLILRVQAGRQTAGGSFLLKRKGWPLDANQPVTLTRRDHPLGDDVRVYSARRALSFSSTTPLGFVAEAEGLISSLKGSGGGRRGVNPSLPCHPAP